ncbi:MAG: hypothetical protein WED34_13615 [Planctomycetales bacterium]
MTISSAVIPTRIPNWSFHRSQEVWSTSPASTFMGATAGCSGRSISPQKRHFAAAALISAPHIGQRFIASGTSNPGDAGSGGSVGT